MIFEKETVFATKYKASLSIEDYLKRIEQFAVCSQECFLIAPGLKTIIIIFKTSFVESGSNCEYLSLQCSLGGSSRRMAKLSSVLKLSIACSSL